MDELESGEVCLLDSSPYSARLTERLTGQIAKGGGITLAGSTLGRMVHFGLYILLGRVLGAGAYGLYALGFSIAQVAGQFSILGLQNGLVRFVALYKGEGDTSRVKGTLLSAFSIAALASLAVGILLFTASGLVATRVFTDPELGPVLRVFAVALPFFVLLQMAAHSARGFQRMEYYVGVQHISWPILNVSLVALAFLLGFRLMGALYGFLLSAAATALLGLYFLAKRLFPEGKGIAPLYEIRSLVRFSIPVVFIGFGGIILGQADRLMVGYFMSSQDVGIYDAAGRIAIQISFIINSFNMAFAPMIADLYNRGQIPELGELFKRVTRWIVTLTLPLFLMLVLFPGIIMQLFGGEFQEGSDALVALASAHLINAATGAVGFMLIMSGKQNVELANVLALAAVNIGLNIWLIPLYGILGAGIATGLSLALINIIRVVEVKRMIGIQPFSGKWLKPLAAGVGTLLLIMLLKGWQGGAFHWAIPLGLCPVLYLLGLVVLRFEPEDLVIIRALRRKIASLAR